MKLQYAVLHCNSGGYTARLLKPEWMVIKVSYSVMVGVLWRE